MKETYRHIHDTFRVIPVNTGFQASISVWILLPNQRPDGMPDHSLQFLQRDLTRIREIDLMVQSLVRDIQNIALFFHKSVHPIDGGRLVVIGSGMPTQDRLS